MFEKQQNSNPATNPTRAVDGVEPEFLLTPKGSRLLDYDQNCSPVIKITGEQVHYSMSGKNKNQRYCNRFNV